ncbi:mucin-5AC-like isoform X2 [Eriocheir sinensis]|uniref:mucin-5AC-like isoform X2 n=1 Tax=Eriocheir sinensis TaxID=95602 RepID=UPI0021C73A47|nr:mucin-5AC-like isoform X2 [Eriocheir sinensis]
MRLYTPAKSPSSGGEESERERETKVARRDKTFPYEPRPGQRTTDDDQGRHDERLPRDDATTATTSTTTTSTPLHLTRLQDSLPFRSPLREEKLEGMRVEVNGEGHGGKQNGTNSHGPIPTLLQNGADTICSLDSLDSVPWNIEGIETIKENGCKTLLGKWALEENGEHGLPDEDELHALREDNKKLKAALKEAAEVNRQWRQYHEQRQRYVDRLLTMLHEYQHPRAVHSPRQLDVEQGSPEGEARRLQEALTRLQADHDEHVTLLEMQVRAHRDDWEAERSEKQATQTALSEAQARTALLLQELQLLQAKLADTESKRGLCWRCAGPHSASPSTQASPVPAPSAPSPSPGPAASPTPLQEAPQAPLKGWIPVSMLHQIAFSGSTPEHQTPVVQRPLTPSRGGQPHHHHHHHHHHHQQRPTSLNTTAARQGEGYQLEPRSRGSDSKAPSPRRTPSRDKTPVFSDVDERKKYEAMGARPKVLGNLQSVNGKEDEPVEDEKSAKHRARSILASALPVSPVSGGPATPFGVTKSPSTPNMPKGYVPITSTILTPVNFRPPFVANKRPPSVKQNIPLSTTSSPTTPTHTRSGSSPSPSAATTTTTATTTNAVPVRHTSTSSNSVEPQTSAQHNINHSSHTSDAHKPTTQENKATKSHSRGSKTQVRTGAQDRKKVATTSTTNSTPTTTTTTFSTHSTSTTSNTNTTQSRTSINEMTSITPSSLNATTTTTTTLSSSSPTSSTSYHVSSSHSRSTSVSSRSSSQPAGDVTAHQPVQNPGFQPVTVVRASPLTATPGNASSQSGSSTKGQDSSNNGKGRSGSHRASHRSSKPSSPLLPDVFAATTAAEEGHPQTGSATTTTTTTTAAATHSSPANNTAFAAITVTSTASSMQVPHSPSTYSSTPSSRSSSPGISLTTFGLNSEGRGIPGAIFFAMGPEQRGTRSPQPGVSSRRASSSSSGTHSHTPDPVTASHPHDGRPPAGVKSPPVAPNRPATPSAVKEDQWWSMEGGGRGSTGNRQQQGAPGKLVNSTWVKLMGSRADGRQSSGLPWRTARAVSGQTLKQTRRTPTEDSSGDPSDPTSPGSVSSTATFSYTPAVNSPPSSANSSAASSPLPSVNQRDDLKSLASKNITSAIMSYELNTKCEGVGGNASTPTNGPEGVETLSRQDLVCPSCQMLFPPHKHMLFLDHFEACRGPAYADL